MRFQEIMYELTYNPSVGIRICLGESPYLFHFFRKGYGFESWITALCDKQIPACEAKPYLNEDAAVCFTDIPITRMVKYLDDDNSMFSGYAIGFYRDMMYDSVGARPVIYGNEEDEKDLRKTKQHWRFVKLDVRKNDYSWQHEWRVNRDYFKFSDIVKEESCNQSSYPRFIVVAPSREQLYNDQTKMNSLNLKHPSVKYNCITLDAIRRCESDTMLQLYTLGFRTIPKI